MPAIYQVRMGGDLWSLLKAWAIETLVRSLVIISALGFLLPGSARAQTRPGSTALTQSVERVLSGPDWKLGSFPMDEGERQEAYSPTFNDNGFKMVTVPGEVQLQLGFKGMDLYYQTKELTLINDKEWWYRKRFTVPKEDSGKLLRLEFDGVDYFASVWLNGKKLGDHEGCFVPFSFDASSHLKYGAENLLVVKVTCPWLPKGRGFLEYMKGEWMMNDLSGIRFPFAPYIAGPRYANTPAYGNATFPMGLWRDVKLVASGLTVIEDLFVRTKHSIQTGVLRS